MKEKITFALLFANRGFFPGDVIADARREMCEAVKNAGFEYICMEESATRYGAVETIAEGKKYADFLEQNRGKYDGVIVSLPNFGDENGISVALKNAGVPILVQAYPDEIGKMDFARRRDALCGKFAVCNILRQMNIPYTLTEKFVIKPDTAEFAAELYKFGAICRTVKGMKNFNIGAIGARTTAFKTVRVDEMALAAKGINVETIDLSELFARVRTVSDEDMNNAKERILGITRFAGYPEEKLNTMAKVQVAVESLVRDYDMDAVAIRCWNEFETELGIAPCTTLSLLNDMGIAAACEVDVENAVMMRALALAAESASTLLDFNNNYGEEEDKAIMFHCGPVPSSMCEGKGQVCEHLMFKKTYGDGSGVGVNKTEMKSGNITIGSVKTEGGKIYAFLTDAKFTDDPIEKEFFGSGKVVKKDGINEVANYMATYGYKHHLAVTFGNFKSCIAEALGKYLGYEVETI
ncbi:MAG: hypothetical protein J6D20_08585 [Clostridia bacterium]|nr:hypothetical protein [Clostridia bacterium]